MNPFAQSIHGQNHKISADKLLPVDVDVEEESPYQTLEEAAKMVAQSSDFDSPDAVTSMDYEMDESDRAESSTLAVNHRSVNQFIGHSIPKDFLEKAGLLNATNDESDSAEPMYKLNRDGSVKGNFIPRATIANFQS